MNVDSLFYPKAVALIGASKDVGSVGNEIAKNLATQGYRGKLFFVNPKGGKLYGKKIYIDPSEIPHSIDLAIIAIPAPLVQDEIKLLSQLKVKSAVVISSGFSESGEDNIEQQIAQIATEANIALIGPNCLGIINPEIRLNASFAPLMGTFGHIAFISQSGALCASVLDYAAREKVGFSKFISVGNKAQITEVELLEYLYADPKTKVIAIYVEELEKVDLLKEVAKKITTSAKAKPIIVLKAGKTPAGQKAALSHTGSIAGNDTAYEALFRQTGIIRVDTIEELFDTIECFSRNKSLKNDRVAVISNAGGPAVITADTLTNKGLNLAKLTSTTTAKLKSFLPKAASLNNPIDILGDADSQRYKQTLEIILDDENVDAVEIILTPQSMTEVRKTASGIIELKRKSNKPIVVSFIGQDLTQEGVDLLNLNKVATSSFPESAASALSALNIFHKWQHQKKQQPLTKKGVSAQTVRKILNKNLSFKGELLPTESAFEILEAYGLPIIKRFILKSKADAEILSKQRSGLFVLKIISSQINHKTEAGGVVLNVMAENITKEYQKLIDAVTKKIPSASIDGVSAMPMITGDTFEIIIGATTDPKLGKQIMVGLGGIYAEVIHDVSWGLAPLTRDDISRMISRLKISKILSGYRSNLPFAQNKIEDSIARLSQLVTSFPQISEVDINPVIVSHTSATIVDTRIALSNDMI